MKRLLFIFAVILCVLTACRTNRDRLIEINGLLNNNQLDSAQICLNMVNPSDLSRYDKALYNLVTVKLNHLSYRPTISDTLIRYSVNTFTRFDDKERLAESLYYQAVVNYEDGRVPQAFKEIKKAEAVAEDIEDLGIRHKIIESLTDWNMSEHQYQIAMTYGKRNLALSTMANNNNWIAYALVFISQIYAGMGQRDSASQYLDKCITYMKHVPDSQRVDFYNYIAANTMKTDLATAHSYAMMGNAIRPNSVSYVTLAKIRYQEGDYDAVDSLCEKAYKFAINPGERKFVYQQVIHLYENLKRYDKAFRASMAFVKTWDKEALLREEHNVSNVQAAYDYKVAELQAKQKIYDTILAIILPVLILVLIILYYHYRTNPNSKKARRREQLLKTYRQENEELRISYQEMETKVNTLNDRNTNFREIQAKKIFEGRKLYEQIENGGDKVKWGDDGYDHFIEFYNTIDPPFVSHLENDYNNLSPQNMTYMILYHMDKNDKEVAKIMGVAEDSLRMIKTRLRRKENRG